jgi:Holliday junction DNA helicase RuvB
MIEESTTQEPKNNDEVTPFEELNSKDNDFADLRPDSFEGFVGQKKVLEQVKIMVESAKHRKAHCDHLLFYGFPGLGKTSISRIISSELGVNLHTTSGQAITKPGDIAAILSNLQDNDVLFIDEIHRLRPNVEEILYTAMEDFVIDIVLGKGPSAKSMRIDVPRFTLVGATTLLDKISSPLRDRFGAVLKMNLYNEDSLSEIINNNAQKLGLNLDRSALEAISKASRGTPRISNNILKRVRDYALVKDFKDIDAGLVLEVLSKLSISPIGMDQTDLRILNLLYENSERGALGLKSIAAAVHESVETVENLHEPYLIRLGLIQRTHRGRLLTEKGIKFAGSLE